MTDRRDMRELLEDPRYREFLAGIAKSAGVHPDDAHNVIRALVEHRYIPKPTVSTDFTFDACTDPEVKVEFEWPRRSHSLGDVA